MRAGPGVRAADRARAAGRRVLPAEGRDGVQPVEAGGSQVAGGADRGVPGAGEARAVLRTGVEAGGAARRQGRPDQRQADGSLRAREHRAAGQACRGAAGDERAGPTGRGEPGAAHEQGQPGKRGERVPHEAPDVRAAAGRRADGVRSGSGQGSGARQRVYAGQDQVLGGRAGRAAGRAGRLQARAAGTGQGHAGVRRAPEVQEDRQPRAAGVLSARRDRGASAVQDPMRIGLLFRLHRPEKVPSEEVLLVQVFDRLVQDVHLLPAETMTKITDVAMP